MSVDILNKINQRYLQALGVHRCSAELFTFLAFNGFAEMHKHRYFCESKTQLEISEFIIASTNTLPEITAIPQENVLAVRKNRLQIQPNEVWNLIKENFYSYRIWESETLSILEECARQLSSSGDVLSELFVKRLCAENFEELQTVNEYCIAYSAIDYNLEQLRSEQDTLAERYIFLTTTINGKPKMYHHFNSYVDKNLRGIIND